MGVFEIMKMQTINHSGYINLKSGKHIAYDFLDGYLNIHAAENISELDGQQVFLTENYDGKKYLFYSQIPIRISGIPIYPHNYRYYSDCAIENYQAKSVYTKAVFRFDELQHFCPSFMMATESSDDQVLFIMKPEVVKSFDVLIEGKECKVQFVIKSSKTTESACRMESFSEIFVEFDETNDFEFLKTIYMMVKYAFAFICNRKNIACNSMKLVGTYPSKTNNYGKIVDTICTCCSELYFFDKYDASPENGKIIQKTSNVRGFLKHIDKLFQMIAVDLSRIKENNDLASISITSIHPSVHKRNLIDLQQSLQITAAFEFYVNRYLPPIIEEKEYHKIVKDSLDHLIELQTGKAKKLLKSLRKHIGDVSLADKIIAAYEGFDGWESLKPCLSEVWFQDSDIEALANAANDWRNELAHEKREYQPNRDTVYAVRFVEHLNYAIVLRQLGYEDIEIKALLEYALTR